MQLPLFFLFMLVGFSVTSLLAQTGEQPAEADTLNVMFLTFGSLVAAIPPVVEVFKKILGKTKASPNLTVQIFSWLVGVLLTVFAKLLGLGFLAALDWSGVILYGLGASLAANGVADTKIIQGFLKLLKK